MVYYEALAQHICWRLGLLPHCRPFGFTRRPMRGWIMLAPEATMEETGPSAWIDRGVTFAFSLPARGGEG